MSDALTAKQGSLYIQFTAGKKAYYVGCIDADALTEPLGDSAPILCRDTNGNVKAVGSVDSLPGAPTISLTTLLFPEQGTLDAIGNCKVAMYLLQDPCGKLGMFNAYKRGRILWGAKATTRTEANLAMRESGDQSTMQLDFSGSPPVYRFYPLEVNRQDIAETVDLNAIAFCNSERCAGDCGPAMDVCEEGYIVTDAPGGSPAAYADTWDTVDGGDNWTLNVGGATHPFGAGYDIRAAVCFPIDADSTRWLVFRETVAGSPLQCARSDDGGATWTTVSIGSHNGEGVDTAQAVFSFDKDHIWVATDHGNVYFSEDGGLTWEDQDADTASGAAVLNAIHFADYNNGYAVGDAGAIIRTTDGGGNWSNSPEDPSGGDNLESLHVWSAYRIIVGTNTGELYQSWDAGETYEAKTYTGQAATDEIRDISFANDYCGFMIVNPLVGQSYVYKSVDGGHSWEQLSTPPNAGLNDLYVCGCNKAYAVGDVNSGTGVVLQVA